MLDAPNLEAPTVDPATIAPAIVRYIKLGAGGCWDAASLDQQRIDWGLPSDPHELASSGKWAALRQHYLKAGLSASVATAYTSEAKYFYADGSDVMWVTIARGRFWWTFADPHIHLLSGKSITEGSRYRATLGGWRDCDRRGGMLLLDRLSTRLTKLAAYRRTICTLSNDQRALCLRYINADPDPDQVAVQTARDDLQRCVAKIVERLSWSDFEALVDLILQRSGWLRVSALGGMLKDVDLIVEQPLTGERMAIQVKSSASQAVVNDYASRLSHRPPNERLLLICHSPQGALAAPVLADGRCLTLMTGPEISKRVVGLGLVDWVVSRQ